MARSLTGAIGGAARAALAIALASALFLAAAPTVDAQTYGFVAKWGTRGSGDGQFDFPYDVATDQAGNVYVSDWINDRIQKFASDGQFIAKWGNDGGGDGQFRNPWGVATDQAGNVYVADFDNNRIQKFTSAGQFMAKWGSFGSGDGLLHDPRGVATDQAGNVYVADSGNDRIQKFTSDGQFITKWGTEGRGDGQFVNPGGIATDQAGNVHVVEADSLGDSNRIQTFSSDGQFIRKWGTVGGGDGQFRNPFGIATDQAGNVYVADTDNERIQKFTPDGRFITKWGSLGPGNGQFRNPWGVAVDRAGNVYVADRDNHRIQKFWFAPEAGRTAVARVLSGTVLVSSDSIRQARAQASGASELVPLTDPTLLAIGALVDATRGALELLTASNLQGGTQKGEFSNGKFKLRQKRSSKPVTDVVLNEKLRCGKAKTGSSSRSLDANARGRYRVVGRYATGSPRGRARWKTRDTCTATSIKVEAGKVTVRDLSKRRTVVVKKGRSYRARKGR